MNDKLRWAAFAGFAFVAAWIAFGFGRALLCVLGAVIVALAVAIFDGQLDLGELQSRFGGEDDAPTPPSAMPPPPPAPRRPGRARVR